MATIFESGFLGGQIGYVDASGNVFRSGFLGGKIGYVEDVTNILNAGGAALLLLLKDPTDN